MDSLVQNRTGITTGTCAAAAAAAAARALALGDRVREVMVRLPAGTTIPVSISELFCQGEMARATVVKDAGSDPDITNGAEIIATVRRTEAAGCAIKGGTGVGIVTLAGLQVPVGQPAINPAPRRMIRQAVSEYMPPQGGLEVEIAVPRGAELARRTFNPRLGIIGGISILGTTGIVRPMSKEALLCSLLPALDVARANGMTGVFLVPGNIGRKAVLERFKPHPLAVVEMSNFAGDMLERAVKLNFERLVLAGHPGKLGKLIEDHFCTDSAVSPSAAGIVMNMARAAGLKTTFDSSGAGPVTVEGIISLLEPPERKVLFDKVAAAIVQAACRRYGIKNLAVWLCDLKGREVGASGII
ncbi:cobalt-precorrin-5B (C(1))-methyltransferase CbiD [Pelotomaculum propionicicum]|uniref:Cobalt-precorrin-5B C(1)-methyltransferase n=1 Tax=Pelotomaculum propionicicum TaxID=258475 RepID=A0A4Y7RUI7_9FIRM|nr:cobalt-precorrin-5B (C(1))-methyltransferase CbiD [Pelotomaculum propionicicum]TEB11927.1 Cobalt-precorrin-5B C(1)-methyltransferase [Pelotomaculum propionicicum]